MGADKNKPPPPRVVVEGVRPEVDCGRFPAKRVLGEEVTVEADVFGDSHDAVAAELAWRCAGEREWQLVPMSFLGNDRWRGSFRVAKLGRYEYTVRGWVDPFLTWQRDLAKRRAAGQDLSVELLVGAELTKSKRLKKILADEKLSEEERCQAAAEAPLEAPDPWRVVTYDKVLQVSVDPVKARFSTWYEMFPRSVGTLRDCVAVLPYVAGMGFDVLYLPPVHPIGRSARKGRNGAVEAQPGDVGSPWAIGAEEGGHKSIHPDLGTLEDFDALVEKAAALGIDVALDIAFQASPDHPYLKERPEWFRRRPDGSIQHAENPPKKYQDIVPFDFESAHWSAMWQELKSVFEFWIGRGVKIFRVDNPHTKAFPFWEWAIGELKREHPELVFLAEAFTRPRVMHRLAKLGFTQSYTYFAWRNSKWELEQYFAELAQSESREYFRPNVWPNTPDILTEYLQQGGRPAFVARAVLAATLAASYGIYGPAFELAVSAPREPGSEEYLDSEKYEARRWDRERPDSLRELIARLNAIRREHAALQRDWTLRFHPVDNPQLIAYSKTAEDGEDPILCVVNLDPYHRQSGWLELPLADFGLDEGEAFQVHDLLGGARYLWSGARNYVELDPWGVPAHVFALRRRARTERDFDYFA